MLHYRSFPLDGQKDSFFLTKPLFLVQPFPANFFNDLNAQEGILNARNAASMAASRPVADLRSMLSDDNDDSEIFICSISLEIMSDPVTTSDGQTYERSAIMGWFLKGNSTSPLTGLSLLKSPGDAHPTLIPNFAMRSAIELWKKSKLKMEPRSAVTIGAQVGAGSFKKVYKGTFYGINVAVVMMKQGSISDELKNMIKVSRHINLLHLIACVIDNAADELIITEFAPLGALDAFIEEGGPGDARTSSHESAILTQICNGMIALHAGDIVHCDLACRNILVFSYNAHY